MALTPNILMATEGLLDNTALTTVPLKTSDYESQAIVADFAATYSRYVLGESNGRINQSLVDTFAASMDATTPYISNSPVGESTSDVNYSTIIDQHAENLFPTGEDDNNQIFAQYAMIAMGQKETANKYINSALNATTKACPEMFTTQDALMSGNLSAVNTDTQRWGDELAASGKLFDFAKLDNLGTPQAIVEALMRSNTLGLISDELTLQGIDVTQLVKAIQSNPTQVLSPLAQKRCYDAFETVTGLKLRNILDAMQFETTGLSTLVDLLDLTKVFPTTFDTLVAPNNGVLTRIFTSSGAIQTWVASLVSPVTAVIPDQLAKSNWAFIIALGQVKGILTSTTAAIAEAASNMEGNAGLDNTAGLDVALPESTATYILDSMGYGTGPDGTFYLSDLIGAPAGLPYNENIDIMVTNLNNVTNDSGFQNLSDIFLVMRGVLTGVYDIDDGFGGTDIEIPVGTIGEGYYNNETSALTVLLAEQDTAVDAYIATYPTEHQAIYNAFTASLDGVVGGIKQLWDADIRFQTTYVTDYETGDPALNGIPANKKTTMAFAENLNQYGKKTDKGNIASILEVMATDTLGGNAIIAAMREGRNMEQLGNAGITGDNEISDQPTLVEPGNIS